MFFVLLLLVGVLHLVFVFELWFWLPGRFVPFYFVGLSLTLHEVPIDLLWRDALVFF